MGPLLFMQIITYVLMFFSYGINTRNTGSLCGTIFVDLTILFFNLPFITGTLFPWLTALATEIRAKIIIDMSAASHLVAQYSIRTSTSLYTSITALPWSLILNITLFALLSAIIITWLLRFHEARILDPELTFWRGTISRRQPPPPGAPTPSPAPAAQAQSAAEPPSDSARDSSATKPPPQWQPPKAAIPPPPGHSNLSPNRAYTDALLELQWAKWGGAPRTAVRKKPAHKTRLQMDRSNRSIRALRRRLSPSPLSDSRDDESSKLWVQDQAGAAHMAFLVELERFAQSAHLPFGTIVDMPCWPAAVPPHLRAEAQAQAAYMVSSLPELELFAQSVDVPFGAVEDMPQNSVKEAEPVAAPPPFGAGWTVWRCAGVGEEEEAGESAAEKEQASLVSLLRKNAGVRTEGNMPLPTEFVSWFAALRLSLPKKTAKPVKAVKKVHFKVDEKSAPLPAAPKVASPHLEEAPSQEPVTLVAISTTEQGHGLPVERESTLAVEENAGLQESSVAASTAATPAEKKIDAAPAPMESPKMAPLSPSQEDAFTATPSSSVLAAPMVDATVKEIGASEESVVAASGQGVPIAPGGEVFDEPFVPIRRDGDTPRSVSQGHGFTTAPVNSIANVPVLTTAVEQFTGSQKDAEAASSPAVSIAPAVEPVDADEMDTSEPPPVLSGSSSQGQAFATAPVSSLAASSADATAANGNVMSGEAHAEQSDMDHEPTGEAIVVVATQSDDKGNLADAGPQDDTAGPVTADEDGDMQDPVAAQPQSTAIAVVVAPTVVVVAPTITKTVEMSDAAAVQPSHAPTSSPAPGFWASAKQNWQLKPIGAQRKAEMQARKGTVYPPITGKNCREAWDEGPDLQQLMYEFQQRDARKEVHKPVFSFEFDPMDKVVASEEMVQALAKSARQLERVINSRYPLRDNEWQPFLKGCFAGIQKYAGYSSILAIARKFRWNGNQIEASAAGKIKDLAESILDKLDSFKLVTQVEYRFHMLEGHCNVLMGAYVRPAPQIPLLTRAAPAPVAATAPAQLSLVFPTPQSQPMMDLAFQGSSEIAADYGFDSKSTSALKTILASAETALQKSAAILCWLEFHSETLNQKGNDKIFTTLAGKFARDLMEIMKWAFDAQKQWDENKTELCIARRVVYATEAILGSSNVANNAPAMKALAPRLEALKAAVH